MTLGRKMGLCATEYAVGSDILREALCTYLKAGEDSGRLQYHREKGKGFAKPSTAPYAGRWASVKPGTPWGGRML